MNNDFKLFKGDCLEVMNDIPDNSVDLIVTSPPYFNAKSYSHWNTYENYINWLIKTFDLIYKKLKDGRMCCVNLSPVIQPRKKRSSESIRLPIPFDFTSLMTKHNWKFMEDIIWEKPSGSCFNRNGGFYRSRKPIAYKPNIITEYILVFQKPINCLIDDILKKIDGKIMSESLVLEEYEKNNIWKMNPETKSKHPAPFPLDMPLKLIKYYSYKNETVLDPFMGSGTTGVACINTNRKFIGIEKIEDYYNMSVKRINKEYENN